MQSLPGGSNIRRLHNLDAARPPVDLAVVRLRTDDLSEKHESKIWSWCHCQDVSKVRTVFLSGLWALPILLSSAKKLA